MVKARHSEESLLFDGAHTFGLYHSVCARIWLYVNVHAWAIIVQCVARSAEVCIPNLLTFVQCKGRFSWSVSLPLCLCVFAVCMHMCVCGMVLKPLRVVSFGVGKTSLQQNLQLEECVLVRQASKANLSIFFCVRPCLMWNKGLDSIVPASMEMAALCGTFLCLLVNEWLLMLENI